MTATNATMPTITSGDEKSGEFMVPVKRQQQIGVTWAMVRKQPFIQTIRTVGVVAYDKQRHWDYVTRVDGYVKDLFVFSRGEMVDKEAPLLTIYSPGYLITQNDFIEALKTQDAAKARHNAAVLEEATQSIDAARQRLRLLNITDSQIAELETNRRPAEMLTLRSPFKGVVQDIAADQGRRVTTGDRLVEIADLSAVWVWAQFYQDELPMLKVGLHVTITTSAHPGEKFTGKISVVDPFLNEASRTGRVLIDMENADLKLRPNMYVDVEVTRVMGEGIAVPFDAVLPTGQHNIVFVDKGGGKLEPRSIALGRKYGDFCEVKDGLEENERVVTGANFLIDAEAKVQGALKTW